MQIHLIDNIYFVMEDTRSYFGGRTYVTPKKKMAEQKKQIAKNTQANRFKYASR